MLSNQKGQSLMELVVVIAVMVIVIGALTFATIASLRNAQFSKNQSQATKLAQEGIEWVRTGRDRNSAINIQGITVTSWNGDGSSNTSIWEHQITGNNVANNCDYEVPTNSPPISWKCYFKILSDGSLSNIGFASQTFPSSPPAESIPPNFTRVITLSDDSSYAVQKTVTAIVKWSDFSGDHESRLTTILRKI